MGVYEIFTEQAADGTWKFLVTYDEDDYTHVEDGEGYATEQEARDAGVAVLENWGLI